MSLIVHSTQTDFGVICLTQIESFNATMSKQPGLIPVLVLERIFAGTTTIEIISVQRFGSLLTHALVISTASMKFSRKLTIHLYTPLSSKANNESRRTFNMLFANAARGTSLPSRSRLYLLCAPHHDFTILPLLDMSLQTWRGSCSTL
jgi:hypothetical protein